jgi:glucose/arabinose dehydrogenase
LDPAGGTTLYIAEETKISKVALYSEDSLHKIADLPEGGRHYTRTLLFGPDGRLYVSIGSTCDVCNEKDERIASIYSMNKDGSDFKKEASGLRNSVFMATNPVDGSIWATEMGRDNLGNDLPPDEINIIDGPSTNAQGQNPPDFGWPTCYGQNVHDTDFDPVKKPSGSEEAGKNPCNGKVTPAVELPAHSAPLGLAFIPEEGWPEDLGNDLLVAFHGSWNRTEPTGYKIARVKLNSSGKYEGMDSTGSPQVEDFISGWLSADGKTSLGRPVDLLTMPGGSMYVSDDKAGVIYKVQYLPTVLGANIELFKDLSVKENQQISSPVKISGQALGTWFFEGSFPVSLMDGNFKELTTGIAQAKGNWMAESFVPFEVELTFNKPATADGWLVFKKDNPSGLPENDAEYHLPIKF